MTHLAFVARDSTVELKVVIMGMPSSTNAPAPKPKRACICILHITFLGVQETLSDTATLINSHIDRFWFVMSPHAKTDNPSHA